MQLRRTHHILDFKNHRTNWSDNLHRFQACYYDNVTKNAWECAHHEHTCTSFYVLVHLFRNSTVSEPLMSGHDSVPTSREPLQLAALHSCLFFCAASHHSSQQDKRERRRKRHTPHEVCSRIQLLGLNKFSDSNSVSPSFERNTELRSNREVL